MEAISFKAKPLKPDTTEKLGTGMTFVLPSEASVKLPSRGMTVVDGTLNNIQFQVPLEPDGQGSHWFNISKSMRETANLGKDDTVSFKISPAKKWPEPVIPADLKKALLADQEAFDKWSDITTMARWDWIRWLDAVVRAETRKERPEKLCSMLRSGKRRPCCFNRAYRSNPRTAELV